MPQITVKVLEGRKNTATEGTSYFEAAFNTDEVLDEGNNTAEVTVESASLIAELRGKERHSVFGKARKLRVVLEREYNLPFSQNEFKVMWLYVCLVILAANIFVLLFFIYKKRHGLVLLSGVALVLFVVVTIYCGVCAGRKYGISAGTRVYSIPESNASVTSELPAGNRVQIISETQNWYQMRFGETEGWILKDTVFEIK